MAELNNEQSPRLDEEALQRVLHEVMQRGPALIKRGQQIRRLKRVGIVAASASFVVLMGLAWSAQQWTTSLDEATPSPSLALAPVRACSTWLPVVGLELGPRGVAVAEGDVRLQTATPCETVFVLESGTLTVSAHDLGGGNLVVRSGQDDVVVVGTLFSVARAEGVTTVATVEGVVEVRGRGQVVAGSRAVVKGPGLRVEVLDMDSIKHMREVVAPKAAAMPEGSRDNTETTLSKPAPARAAAVVASAEELVLQAQLAKKAGQLAKARRLLAQAGRRDGITAEAAWLGLARLELKEHKPRAALRALGQRERRFPSGSLALESTWLKVQALESAGDHNKAKESAEQIVKNWPESAQAKQSVLFLKRSK